MHISGYWQGKKVDIDVGKVDIQNEKVLIDVQKVDFESVLSVKMNDFSEKTAGHIQRLFQKFGYECMFSRCSVMEVIDLKGSGASKLISKLLKADIIEPVSGYGKGKYKFKR